MLLRRGCSVLSWEAVQASLAPEESQPGTQRVFLIFTPGKWSDCPAHSSAPIAQRQDQGSRPSAAHAGPPRPAQPSPACPDNDTTH